MRLFIGIFPPKEILDELRDTVRLYEKHKRNLKFAPIDQMHITLKYIGSDVSESSYEIIRNHLHSNQKKLGPVEINLKKLKFGFHFDTYPRVLMVQVEATDALLDAADFYHEHIKYLKLRDTIRLKGKFSSTFHITLARIKESAARSSALHIKKFTEKELDQPKLHSFMAQEVYLMESIMKPGKPITYKKRERLVL